MLKVTRNIEQLNDNMLKLNLLAMRTQELIISIEKAQQTFQHELNVVYHQIYPNRFSKLIKTMKKILLRQNYFSDNDLHHIAYIGRLANEFAQLINSKVFD